VLEHERLQPVELAPVGGQQPLDVGVVGLQLVELGRPVVGAELAGVLGEGGGDLLDLGLAEVDEAGR
jgi:hypothetical protein